MTNEEILESAKRTWSKGMLPIIKSMGSITDCTACLVAAACLDKGKDLRGEQKADVAWEAAQTLGKSSIWIFGCMRGFDCGSRYRLSERNNIQKEFDEGYAFGNMVFNEIWEKTCWNFNTVANPQLKTTT